MPIDRRDVMKGALAGVVFSPIRAPAAIVSGKLPWSADAGAPPQPVSPGSWQFFTADEATAIEAIVNRLIPVDPQTPGGKDAGCAVYLDRQLAGPYGKADGLYRDGPFTSGATQQGDQSPLTPAARCREGLAELDRGCRAAHSGRAFAALPEQDQDAVLSSLEKGEAPFDSAGSKAFFEQLLKTTHEGFFADPIYGGNRDMCAWKMIGFPGARYDYRDWVERHNERYPLPPVSIGNPRGRGRP